MKLGVIADKTKKSEEAYKKLKAKYDFLLEGEDLKDADILLILGGDGFMLHSIHNYMKLNKPFYGMNCGTIGFLLNEFSVGNIEKRVSEAQETEIYPLKMKAKNNSGESFSSLAFNEVSLLRETRQSAEIKIKIDDIERIETLVGDGVVLSTPAGSSAYNFSVRGPIIPICSHLLALTPISPFRPRQWRGAILPSKTKIEFIIQNSKKRPVSAVADYFEFRDVRNVIIEQDESSSVRLLFDNENPLEDKIITEQFSS